MEILKNLYQVSGPPFGTHQNVYVMRGDKELVMVDTGIDADELAVIDDNIAYWGLAGYPVSYVLITHSHYDHCANAHTLRSRGAKIIAGPSDAEGIELGDDRTASYAFSHKGKFKPCKVDSVAKDGTVIKAAGLEIQAIHVPGYTKGSLFYKIVMDNKIIIFTGDVIKIKDQFSNILVRDARFGWSGGMDYDRDQYFETIKKISGMKADILLPGHGQVCMKEGWELFQDAYVEARLNWFNKPSMSLDIDTLA
ncbi:MAG: MBL fold metallo-hydrolase [Spirochaetota bacterium]|nr:MAG: MBL fold metallo-hydrolase [Spirochaetota bacterium]